MVGKFNFFTKLDVCMYVLQLTIDGSVIEVICHEIRWIYPLSDKHLHPTNLGMCCIYICKFRMMCRFRDRNIRIASLYDFL
jgi:hypothetical protein